MTPRLVYQLRRRELNRLQREEWLYGNIATATVNFGFRAPATAISVDAFMIHKLPAQAIAGSSGEDLLRAFAPYTARKKG